MIEEKKKRVLLDRTNIKNFLTLYTLQIFNTDLFLKDRSIGEVEKFIDNFINSYASGFPENFDPENPQGYPAPIVYRKIVYTIEEIFDEMD